MRPGEVFTLNHGDVDYTTGIIHVRRHLALASGVIGWPKGRRATRHHDDPQATPASTDHAQAQPGAPLPHSARLLHATQHVVRPQIGHLTKL